MRILVTGGTGVIGVASVTALLQRGHAVRLLSRHAGDDVRRWNQGVSPWPADVAVEASVRGAAQDCDAVLHIAGIAQEKSPERTFERVNVGGTRHVLAEAERAGVRKFVYVSSLGADRGDSAYHKSKRQGEEVARSFSGSSVIVRPGPTYGPGDEHISVLLRMVRSLPLIPLVGDGTHRFQPIWHVDLGEALSAVLERDDVAGRALDVAGRELTSQRDLIERMSKLTGRSPALVPLPEFLASLGIAAVRTLGGNVPLTKEQLTMLMEGNVVPPQSENALPGLLQSPPTSLDTGLRELLDDQPEQLPSTGVGALVHDRYWADMHLSGRTPADVMTLVRARFHELMPSLVDVAAEPGSNATIGEGETLTLAVPLRGHVLVRVAEVNATRVTLLTLEGHPMAGAVRLLAEDHGDAIRFIVELFERAGNVVDLVMIRSLGRLLQDRNWRAFVRNVIAAVGADGAASPVEHESRSLTEDEAERIDAWLRELALALHRDEAGV